MSDNVEYLIREDNIQKVYLSENTVDVIELLGSNYDYICDSIKKEEFILKSHTCNLFKEIVFDRKVVGFCSYDFSREFITAALNNIYVLPEFRGNKLFYNELIKTMEEHNKPSIMEPTRLVVELLVKYGFAEKLNDSIVASSIEFIIPGNHVFSNTDYESGEELSTHFYDLNTCRCIHFLDLNRGYLAYSSPLNYDIIHYDCLNHEINDDYIENIKNIFITNEAELINIILDLEDNLPIKTYTLEEVIGDDDNLSHYMESLIDDAHITLDDALSIKQQIREEYEAGMILNESLLIRLAYLFGEKKEPTIKSHDEKCPYCNMPVDNHDKYCHFCGINLDYDLDNHFNNLINSFNGSDDEYNEDIRYVAYKFLNLIDEGIEKEYALFTIEKSYNIGEDELTSFLNENSYYTDEITDEGYDFIKNHPLYYYEKYELDIFNYTDFEEYFYKNNALDGRVICISYLKQFDYEETDEIILLIQKDC